MRLLLLCVLVLDAFAAVPGIVDVSTFPEKAAMLSISGDGKTQTFDPARDIVDFPGGAKKFTIRFDATSRAWWSLTSATPAEFQSLGKPSPIRNTLVLLESEDLRSLEIRATLLRHADQRHPSEAFPQIFSTENSEEPISRPVQFGLLMSADDYV